MATRWAAARTGMQRWLAATGQLRALHSSSTSSAVTAFASSFPSAAAPEMESCGRGDKKTKRGKRFKGSYGNARPKLKQRVERIKDRVEVPRSTPWPLPFKLI